MRQTWSLKLLKQLKKGKIIAAETMLVEDYFFLRVETCKLAGELCRKYWFLKHFLQKTH